MALGGKAGRAGAEVYMYDAPVSLNRSIESLKSVQIAAHSLLKMFKAITPDRQRDREPISERAAAVFPARAWAGVRGTRGLHGVCNHLVHTEQRNRSIQTSTGLSATAPVARQNSRHITFAVVFFRTDTANWRFVKPPAVVVVTRR